MSFVIAFIYWNSRKYLEPNMVTFEGSKRGLKINKNISYKSLKKKFAKNLIRQMIK